MGRGSRTKFEHGPITMAEMTISKKQKPMLVIRFMMMIVMIVMIMMIMMIMMMMMTTTLCPKLEEIEIIKKIRRADTSSAVPIQMKTCCVNIKASENNRL